MIMIKNEMKKNKKLLRVGKYTLDETLSNDLFGVMKMWHRKKIGRAISFKKCQIFLDDYDYTIKWIVQNEFEDNYEIIKFFVTVNNPGVLNRKVK